MAEKLAPHPDFNPKQEVPQCPECGAVLEKGTIWAHRFVHWGDDIPEHIRYEGARTRYNQLRKVAERFGE